MEATKPPRSSKKKRVEEIPHAPAGIVGRIVEKNFSPASPAAAARPLPSLLPFPVARHRSHGPHWTPQPPASTAPEPADEDADYEPVPECFAKPVERREKKGLDLSRWREFVNSDGTVKPQAKKKGISTGERPTKADAAVSYTNGQGNYARLEEVSVVEPQPELMETEPAMPGRLKKRWQETSKPEEVSGASSDDIDAENIAMLKEMSVEEIAEAQAEIMERFDPAKLEMLKKRGLNKLEGKSAKVNDRLKGMRECGAGGSGEDGKRAKTEASKLLSSESKSNLWKAWSERVEKVRDLRFSLEGKVVETNSMPERPFGSDSEVAQYSIENVAERDILRSEGDPAALGYTIKEALSLIRSLVPGQRILALQILASVLNKALHNLQKNDTGPIAEKTNSIDKLVDWQAVWAFSLGPEPEVALSLRIALDDNNDSVVFACCKVIQCVLSCDINENYFNIKEKVPNHDKNICTASVFRRRPEVDGDLLHGQYWKYNTKPSNIFPHNEGDDEGDDEENEGNNTIQDDVVVAGQDIAAGLVRMGILPRICYLLEMYPHPSLEECLVCILVALARHSPMCANAIMRCPRLVQTVSKIFTKEGTVEIHPSQIKAVVFLKVLAQSNRQICFDFVKHGIFQGAMWHWYRKPFTLDEWIKSGKEHCKVTSAMLVEQLRLWKVSIRYGYCIASFADFFPVLCLWLSPPAFEKLIDNNLLCEFASVMREAYLVLEALAQRLPNLHSVEQLNKQVTGFSDSSIEAWSWSHVVPMVDLAIKWLSLKNIPFVSSLIGRKKEVPYTQDPSLTCMLWAVSAVLHMLSSIFDRIPPCNNDGLHNSGSHLPWLPQFVPKVGLELVRNRFLGFSGLETRSGDFSDECGSLVEGLCHVRHQSDSDASLSSISLLHGVARLAFSVDTCVQRARKPNTAGSVKEYWRETPEEILEEGVVKCAQNDLTRVLSVFMALVSLEWHAVQSVEMFGRGGPAPGIGVGWGSSGGGFWSLSILLSQMDTRLVLGLLEIFHEVLEKDLARVEGLKLASEGSSGAMDLTIQRINSVLCVCLIAGPGDRAVVETAFDTLLQPCVLKYIGSCAQYVFNCANGFKSFDWQYKEEDYLLFSKILKSHFRDRWLSAKQRSAGKADRDSQSSSITQKGDALETIHENLEISEIASKYLDHNSLLIEWAHQRLPLPDHWFLSAICSSANMKNRSKDSPFDKFDVARSGLYFLLGLEGLSSMPYFGSQDSPIADVPLVWKLHALSVTLHAGVDVLEEERTRNVFETLQELYGQHLDKLRSRNFNSSMAKIEKSALSSAVLPESQENGNLGLLCFQTQVHENYSTFIENIVQQFGAESYGDTTFGRQIALYLHTSVELPVRLVAWTVLSNAHVHGSLPPLDKCIAEAEGYLEPSEQDEGMLEAYAKSWISGALDRAAARGSISFTLAQHHLSSLLFSPNDTKLPLRNKLARSLIRSYSQKPHQHDMLLNLVRNGLPAKPELHHAEIERRFELLKQACDGISSLLPIVQNLRSLA